MEQDPCGGVFSDVTLVSGMEKSPKIINIQEKGKFVLCAVWFVISMGMDQALLNKVLIYRAVSDY